MRYPIHFAATHDEPLPPVDSLPTFEAPNPSAAVVAAFKAGVPLPPGEVVFVKVVVAVRPDGKIFTITLRCPTGRLADLN